MKKLRLTLACWDYDRVAALLLAWLPLVGDALCVAAGWLRMRWPAALAFMAAGRLVRYLAVALIA